MNTKLSYAQTDTPDTGKLQINVSSSITAYPVTNATISISYTGIPENTLKLFRQTHPVKPTFLTLLLPRSNTVWTKTIPNNLTPNILFR